MQGAGLPGNPYIVMTLDDLQSVRDVSNTTPAACFAMGADIDAAPTQFWNAGAGFKIISPFRWMLSYVSAVISDISATGTWTPSAGATLWQVLDRASDATFVTNTASGTIIEGINIVPTYEQYEQVYSITFGLTYKLRRTLNNPNVQSFIVIGGVQYNGTLRAVPLAATSYTDSFAVNPATGLPWTLAGLSSITALGLTTSNPGTTIVYELWAQGLTESGLPNKMTGSFDGRGHTISNLYINRPGTELPCGLFGHPDGTISNLNVIDAHVTGGEFLAILAGTNGTPLTVPPYQPISNCHVSGTIHANTNPTDPIANYVGGLVGFANGTIDNCTANVAIIFDNCGGKWVGGLAGEVNRDVTRCSVIGSITQLGDFFMTYVGGFAGQDNTDTGLILSWADVNIRIDSLTPGQVDTIGGFVGYENTHIENAYSRGDVVINGLAHDVGGFVGFNNADVEILNAYSTGLVVSGDDGAGTIGGFCGRDNATVTQCFWDTQTSGMALSDGGTGSTTAAMRLTFTYLFPPPPWDFVTIWDRSNFINDGYPYFRYLGLKKPNYLIHNPTELQAVQEDLDGDYLVVNDFDAIETRAWNGGMGFIPICNHVGVFSGSIDGQGYTITNLWSHRESIDDTGALIEQMENGSALKNLSFIDVDFGGSQAALIIQIISPCTIESVVVTGKMTAVPGAAGVNDAAGMIIYGDAGPAGSIANISDCQTNCIVIVNAAAGVGFAAGAGFIAYSTPGAATFNFNRCSALGPVTLTALRGFVGGFIAESAAFNGLNTFTRCFALGAVSTHTTGVVAADAAAGGFVAEEASTRSLYSQCFAVGAALAQADFDRAYAGGFCGWCNGDNFTFSDVYARGAATALGNSAVGILTAAGGFFGWLSGASVVGATVIVRHAYSTGVVTAQNAAGLNQKAGFATDLDPGFTTFDNNYWDLQTSHFPTSDGALGQLTAAMKIQPTFIDWDFVTIWVINPAFNDGYPSFMWAGGGVPVLPTLNTQAADGITENLATLHGSLDSNGGRDCLVWFEWGINQSYGQMTLPEVATTGQAFYKQIINLHDETLYHFRAVGQNSGGIGYGADRTFITLTRSLVNSPIDDGILTLLS